MICGVALTVTPALAQTTAGDDEVSEVVVTGTRIPSPNLESVSPVTAVTAAEIKAQGVTRVEDMINSLPQAFAAQGSSISNGATGTATLNLRGLGVSRTLVLIDGRRLMPGDPASTPAGLGADVNFIPSALVERVDVLTGGASAVYGADAVGGVVNFIMTKNFEGVRVDAQYSIYQHDNGNAVADVVRAKAATSPTPELFALPRKNVRDGEGAQVTLVLGTNSPDDKGNITAYAFYRQNNAVLQGDRDYSACTLNSGATFAAAGCGGSGTAFPARFGNFVVDVTSPTQQFRPRVAARDVYNFGPTNFYMRPDERYGMGAFARYEVAPWAEAYADLMFMDDVSTAQIAPGGIFAGTFSINCNNALASAQQLNLLCGADAGTPAIRSMTIARRNVEGGGRTTTFTHTDYRFVVGLRGQLNEAWSYDAYLQYGKVGFSGETGGFFQTARIQNSLFVVRNAAGQPVCQSVVTGSDAACVPYNIWANGGVTRAALDYLETPSFTKGNTVERVANVSIAGDLTDYGIKSPWSEDGVGVAIGGEYRRENLDFTSDFVSRAGLLNGAGGAAPPVNGAFDVYELFAEARVPLVTDRPFAKRLSLELGFRYSDYTSIGTTETYKLAADWEIVDGVRLRGGYNRAVRAPNVLELFSPQNVVLDGTQDPCAGLAASNPLVARCAQAFGLTTAQVLAIEANPANQYNGQVGGNPNLDPETSDTYTLGAVFTPTFLPGFNFTVDYFNIKVKDYISGIGADVIINRCVQTLDPFFCNLVNRDAAGSIWLSSNGFVTDTTLNTGGLRTKGFDFNANYRTDLDAIGLSNMGAVTINFVGTLLDDLSVQSLPGDAFFNCAGKYGTICSVSGGLSSPNPKWRHKFRVAWKTPLEYGEWMKDVSVALQWRHFDKVKLDAYDSDPQLNNTGLQYETDRVLRARDYFDLTAGWTMRDNIAVRVGVNNLFDKDPPLNGSSNCPTGPCNGNTWPQVYDALGRFIFVGATVDF
ncbi:MAG: TonB-dependent receptor [Phenylobacterium sp.]|uniref:TonB-dependent receptor domain-containing protein n=1 Tax=Phenylobacterium sp. TaxID=1871053 RepID=UPI001A3A776F|nr:TonB-dependent receptor [Phenylobacterium sp.]MBL8555126.1 TonB-dependent receptor [Phenylobacterium sp.]